MKKRIVIFLSQVFVLFKKELLQFLRDKILFYAVVYTYTINLIVVGYSLYLEVRNAPTAIYDQCKSVESRELIQSFSSSGRFDIIQEIDSLEEGDNLLFRGKVSFIISIPPDFSRNLWKGGDAKLMLSSDGTDSNQSIMALSYASVIVEDFVRKKLEKKMLPFIPLMSRGLFPEVKGKIRVRYNENLDEKKVSPLMELFRVTFSMCIILTAASLVREKEAGTLSQLFVAPISKTRLLTGKIIPVIFVNLLLLTVGCFMVCFIFDTPLIGNFLLFLLLSIPFLLFSVGIGLLLSDFSKNLQQVLLGAFLIIVPIMFISGSLIPIETMPKVLQILTYLFPLRYYNNIGTGIFLRGTSLSSFYIDALAMTVLGILSFVLSVIFFRKVLD